MAKTIIDAPRAGATFLVWPEEVVLIGRDTEHRDHPLYDPLRVHRPPNEGSVRNMMVNRSSLVSAIEIEIHDEIGNVVADGRGRVIDAREANKRLRERGLEPFQLKAEVKRRVDASTSFERMVVKNAFATVETLASKARKAVAMLDGGVPVEKVLLSFGLTSEDTLKVWRQIAELPEDLMGRVERGTLTATQAVKIGNMSPEARKAALRVVDQRGEIASGERKPQLKRQIERASGKQLPPSRKELRSLLDRFKQKASGKKLTAREEVFAEALELAYRGGDLPDYVDLPPIQAEPVQSSPKSRQTIADQLAASASAEIDGERSSETENAGRASKTPGRARQGK